MKKTRPRILGVALAGCGHVAAAYVRQLRTYTGLKLIGVVGRGPERAKRFAREHGLRAYASLQELLDDPAVDLVVNIALPAAHAEITEQCLRAGRHVYSEKPVALDHATARRLVALAKRQRVRLGCAPATFLGEANQTAWQMIRAGRIGRIRVIYAEINHGRIERYHPTPEPFFAVGPLWDVGVYPLTALTAFFGPVRSVRAWGRVVLPHRTAKGGRAFQITTPDFVVATLDLDGGQVVRFTANFYVDRDNSKGGGSIEYHGDGGRLYTGDFQLFDAAVECGIGNERYQTVPFAKKPFLGVEFGRGVEEMADAILKNRPHRATGEHGAHVVEVVEAMHASLAKDGAVMRVRSRFVQPRPMPWAR